MSDHEGWNKEGWNTFEALIDDLAEQCRLATRTAAEGRGDFKEKLLLHLEMSLRAARSAAERLSENTSAPPSARAKASDLVAAHDAFERQTIDVMLRLGEIAEGWRCGRCGVAVPRAVKLRAPPDVGAPVLECRACSAETPVTEAGAAAFRRIFGHLIAAPAWNPAVNGFTLIGR